MILQQGDQLAGYRIEGPVGVGGMGMVYRATQLSLDRVLALKVLSPELAQDEQYQERFRREAKLAAGLDHPNIVPVFEAGEADGVLFIAMRFVDGRTLSDRMRDGGLSPAETFRILSPIGAAIDAAHDAGLIHRDVKPANILLAASGHPYLADFGIAKGAAHTQLTKTRGFLGSTNYAAPEQIEGTGATRATDIYALTGILFHCLAGQVPYERESEPALMKAHLEAPPPSFSDAGVEVPTALDDVMARGMAKRGADRFPTAGVLMEETERALAMLPEGAAEAGPLSKISATGDDRGSARRGGADMDSPSRIMVPAADSLTIVDRLRPRRRSEKPTKKRRGWDHPNARAVAGGLLLATAIVVGGLAYVATHSGEQAEAHELQTPDMTLTYGPRWEASSPSVAGVRLKRQMGLERTERGGKGTLAAGVPRDVGTRLDPASAALKKTWLRPAKPRAVKLGDSVEALAYDATLKRGGKQIAYFVPSSRGWIALVCQHAGSTDFFKTCQAVAASIAPVGRTEAVRPDPALARTLDAATSKVAKDRRAQAKRLGSKSLSARARGARALAGSHGELVKTLARADVGGRDRVAVAALVRATRTIAKALTRLEGAARSRNRAAYEHARRQVSRADKRLRARLLEFRGRGYAVH